MKGMVGELFHFSAFRILTSLLPLVTSLLGLGLHQWSADIRLVTGAILLVIPREGIDHSRSPSMAQTPKIMRRAGQGLPEPGHGRLEPMAPELGPGRARVGTEAGCIPAQARPVVSGGAISQ